MKIKLIPLLVGLSIPFAVFASTTLFDDSTQTVTNKTIDGDNNTISNLDLGNEVDWAAAADVGDRTAFASGDKILIFEAGVGMRKIDYDDLPSASGAPTDADYLVGTANGTLSAEIVVGTSPQGELGGTWASPTIDDSVTVTGWTLGTSSATEIDATGVSGLTIGDDSQTLGIFIEDGGNVGAGQADPDTQLDVAGAITARELSSDPSDPDEGSHVIWQSDGTGSGDDGDIMIKITAGAVTKTVTLIDFSVAN